MCYTKRQIDIRVKKLETLEAAKKDLEKEIDAIKKDLQTDMGDAERVEGDRYRVNWTKYETSRFNTKGFSAAFPDVAKAWTVTSESRRFSWATI